MHTKWLPYRLSPFSSTQFCPVQFDPYIMDFCWLDAIVGLEIGLVAIHWHTYRDSSVYLASSDDLILS